MFIVIFLQIITSNVTMVYENVHNRDCSSVVENVFLTRNISYNLRHYFFHILQSLENHIKSEFPDANIPLLLFDGIELKLEPKKKDL